MASIDDVFNQLTAVNTKLTQLHADEVASVNATTQVKSSVDALDTHVTAGFGATLNALKTIAQIDIEAVKLLFHLTEQSDAIICILEHISKNTCRTLTEVTIQTQLQKQMHDDLDVIRDITEFAHPDAVLARARLAELRAQVERCCPPDQPRPACSYEPCPHPKPAPTPHLPPVDDQPPRVG